MSSIDPRKIHLNIIYFPFYEFLAPETDIMVQFLEPETDVMVQFLAPEIVIMGQRIFMNFWPQKLTLWFSSVSGPRNSDYGPKILNRFWAQKIC